MTAEQMPGPHFQQANGHGLAIARAIGAIARVGSPWLHGRCSGGAGQARQGARHLHGGTAYQAVEHGDLQIAASAGEHPADMGGKDPDRGMACSREIARLKGRHRRSVALIEVLGKRACHRLNAKIVPRNPAETGVVSHARNRAVDQRPIARGKGFIVDAQTFRHAGPKRLDHDVGGVDQAQGRLAVVGLGQVEGNAALVSVVGVEIDTNRRIVRRVETAVIADSGLLDLDHIGAQIGQCLSAPGARQQSTEVDDADPVQRQIRSFSRICTLGRNYLGEFIPLNGIYFH